MMKVLGVLQARYSSTRLPGKVLKPLQGFPMLLHQIWRLERSSRLEKLVVATSSDASDDLLAATLEEHGVSVYRGSLEDVLDRFCQAARKYQPEHVVRLTGDCPLTDPAVMDEVIALHLDGDYDYTSNCFPPTFPDGLDVEVVRFACLEEAWREATLPSEREHVTPFIHSQPHRYRQGNHRQVDDLSGLRWTVDEPEDFAFVQSVYAQLYPVSPAFGMDEVLNLLKRQPELSQHNRKFQRNEGYAKSLEKDKPLLNDKE
ncbi:glycosyltransferase family protein [Desulfurispirillum indicum]|nr:glycosyltransferase family protein [Desulfurispirillum indicum]UCZ57553.1 glycosyltransferase family protein [Desulfurispirillum indicum]